METGFGSMSPRTFFKIKEGHIVITILEAHENNNQHLFNGAAKVDRYTDKNGNAKVDIYHQWLQGHLEKIEKRKTNFNNVEGYQWNVYFGMNDGSKYILSTYYNGSVIQGMVNSLLSASEIGIVKILAYLNQKGGTGIAVYNNDEKLDWKYQLEKIIDEKTKKERWIMKDPETGEIVPDIEYVMTVDKAGNNVPVINPQTKRPIIDDTARMEFFEVKIAEINDKLRDKNPAAFSGPSNGESIGSAMDPAEALEEDTGLEDKKIPF